ncbi:hypothetical protein TW65_06102 [Stemphylium lycopersici]|nr:hypothetical protein TW65_06102 [Stemphylium lycopersici]
MPPYHNNQLSMDGLYDTQGAFTPGDQSSAMLWPFTNNDSSKTQAPVNGYFNPYESTPQFSYDVPGDSFYSSRYMVDTSGSPYHERETPGKVKNEEVTSSVSYTPAKDSDYVESDGEYGRPSKMPKINKDGMPRKPRQPRPKLLKWSDNDWKNVVLGIIWACGEAGVQIPFDQAAQVVDVTCTASALQQAILKLRGKQISEGHQIPSLKMAWTRKNRNGGSSSPTADAKTTQDTSPFKTPIKKRTLHKSISTLIVTLKIAPKKLYTEKLYHKLPEEPKMPGADQSLVTSRYFSVSPISRPLGQAPPTAQHLPQQRVSRPCNKELLTFEEMMKESESIDTYRETEGQAPGACCNARNPFQTPEKTPRVVQLNDALVGSEGYIMATTEDLRSLQASNIPEEDPFVDGPLANMSSQANSFFDSYEPVGEWGQGYSQGALQQSDPQWFPGYGNYDFFTEYNENHGLLDGVFKDENPVAKPFNRGFFTELH